MLIRPVHQKQLAWCGKGDDGLSAYSHKKLLLPIQHNVHACANFEEQDALV